MKISTNSTREVDVSIFAEKVDLLFAGRLTGECQNLANHGRTKGGNYGAELRTELPTHEHGGGWWREMRITKSSLNGEM